MGIVLELIHKIVLVQIYALQKIVLDPILKLPKKNPRDLLEIHQEVDLQITTRDVRDRLPLVGQRSHDLIQLRGCVSVIKKIERNKRRKRRSESPALRNRSSKSVGSLSRIRSSSAKTRRRKNNSSKPPIPMSM